MGRSRPQFSARELDVLAGIAEELTNTQIASDLGIGFESVKTYVSRIRCRLGIRPGNTPGRRQPELVVAAREYLRSV